MNPWTVSSRRRPAVGMRGIEPRPLAVEQQRVLQAGAGEPPVVEADDEGVRTPGVAAGAHVIGVQAARPRPAAPDAGLGGKRREPVADIGGGHPAGAPEPVRHLVEFLAELLGREAVESPGAAGAGREEPARGLDESGPAGARGRRETHQPRHQVADHAELGEIAGEPFAAHLRFVVRDCRPRPRISVSTPSRRASTAAMRSSILGR